VRTASRGEDGIAEFERFDPEVVLCDIRMPDLSGFEVARRLRASFLELPFLMVAMTGFGSQMDREASRQAGFDRHLVKPMDPAELADLIREAAALGKHILPVKPVARSLAEAGAVAEAVRGAGVQCFPLESGWRLSPARARARQWVQEGRIGTPVRFSQTLNVGLPQPWPGSTERASWWLDNTRVPGGGWLDHAIYAIDYARWLFGAEPHAVRGFAGNLRYPELGVEDYGAATFDFPNCVAQIEDSWVIDRGFGYGRSEIVGTAGAISDDSGPWGRLAVRGNFGHEGWMAVEPARGGLAALGHLVDAIHGETALLATIDDAYHNLAACLAFYQAAKEGKTVTIG
jgi:predicted dehydrogenase